jgi:hypothetical protein
MKKLFTLSLVILMTCYVFAQSPQKMSYQCVIRNTGGALVTNQIVRIRISILQGTSTGSVVYTETQTPTTNANGLVSIEIGGGAGFNTINWAAGTYYIKTETDPTGGTNYAISGTSQILTVPYSLYTNEAANGFASVYSTGEKRPVLNITDGSVNLGASPASNIKLNVNGTVNLTPGDFSTWGVNLALDATSQAGGVNFGILSLSNGAGEGGGKFLIKNPSESSTFVMDNNGHTGINNLYPSHNLDVTGDVNFTGALLRNGSPFAGDFNTLTNKPTTIAGYGITDGMSTSHPANSITSLGILNWNTSYSWGNHSGLYRPISYVPSWSEITGNPFSFVSPANNQLLKYNAASSKFENWTPNYLTSFTETDPVFLAWNKSSGISITSSQVSDFQTSVTNNAAMLANTAKVTNATHTGDVTGATALTVVRINGTSLAGLATGILKNTTSTGVPSIAVAGTDYLTPTGSAASLTGFPVLNQNTTGTSASFTGSLAGEVTGTQGATVVTNAAVIGKVLTGFVSGAGTITATDNILQAIQKLDGNNAFHYIGESYGGGIIFYIYGRHGLIAATADQSTGVVWTNTAFQGKVSNAVRDGVNGGIANTERIIIQAGEGIYAAQLCANYKGGNYADWYLPSEYELNLLYLQKDVVGGFASGDYWSSTEYDLNHAIRQSFGTGATASPGKANTFYVRAIRGY